MALILFILSTLQLCSVIRAELCTTTVCEYTFVIELKSSHTYETGGSTFDVGLSGSTLTTQANRFWDTLVGTPIPADDVKDVVTLDGFRRDVILINNNFPGPTIDVIEGTQVVVNVVNRLFRDTLTIHWHGLHQKDNLWMDGVPYITQCPILPGFNFTYRFIADPVGTHWYHSHLSFQRIDGLFGMLLIHPRSPKMPYSHMSIIDWLHPHGETIKADLPVLGTGPGNLIYPSSKWRVSFAHHLDSLFTFDSILVNGRGRQMNMTDQWPLEVFVVKSDHPHNIHRFHVANTGTDRAVRVSVDQHELTIVATDDGDIHPIKVESFWLGVAETIDFTIKVNRPPSKYWIRLETLGSLPGIFQLADGMTPQGRAVLMYDGVSPDGNPTSTADECTQQHPCVVFNCPFEKYPLTESRVCQHMDSARTVMKQNDVKDAFGVESSPDLELFLNFNFINEASINGHEFHLPRAPFSMVVDDQVTPCDAEHCQDGCDCTHTITLPENKVVQLVFTNYDVAIPAIIVVHPVHLHGNTFAVMKQGFGSLDALGTLINNNPDVVCTTPNCSMTGWANGPPVLNSQQPPLKNTVLVPAQGYTVVRLRSDNAGMWFLHCHLLRHAPTMAALIKIGDPPAVPNGFPQCDNFDFEDFNDYLENSDSVDSVEQ